MDADEREIYYYLKSWRNLFLSAREICRHAGGKNRFRNEPEWAKPVLIRMVERGILDTDPAGHYRLRPPPDRGGTKRWVSPQITTILRRERGDVSDIVISEDELDEYYEKL